MPTWRKKPPNDHNFNKRSTPAQRAALADAAQIATARLYNEMLEFLAAMLAQAMQAPPVLRRRAVGLSAPQSGECRRT
jgi:hypothetical protein